MTLATTTRKDIRQKVIAKLYPHRFPTTSTTTGAASAANRVNDTALHAGGHTEDFVRAWIYIAETEAGSPPVGEVRRVINADFDATTSELIVLPAFTDTINSGMDYEVHYVYHPNRIHERIDAILANLRGRIYVPLTLVTDGDMEASTEAAYTTGGPAGLTLTKETSPVLHGRQSLKLAIVVGNTGHTTRTASILNIPSESSILVSADVYSNTLTGDITMRLIDDDATTVLNSQDFARGVSFGWQTLQFTSQIPAGTEYFYVEFLNNAPSSTRDYYINNVIALPQARKLFDVTTLAERRTDYMGLFSLGVGSLINESTSEKAFRIFEEEPVAVPNTRLLEHQTGVTPFRIVLDNSYLIDSPLFVKLRTNYAALSSDTVTTLAPEDIVVDLVLADMLDFMAEGARDDNDLQKMATYRVDAVNIRRMLRPRMEDFAPQKGIVGGSNAP